MIGSEGEQIKFDVKLRSDKYGEVAKGECIFAKKRKEKTDARGYDACLLMSPIEQWRQ